jgi:hypothetical protein
VEERSRVVGALIEAAKKMTGGRAAPGREAEEAAR